MEYIIMFVVVMGGLLLLLVVLAKLHGGDGSDLLDINPRQRAERRYAAEYEDMSDLLAAHNARRRKKGLPEQTEEEYAEEVRRGRA